MKPRQYKKRTKKQGTRVYMNREMETSSVNPSYDEESAVREAERCLGAITCKNCNVCQLFCPELCITRNEREEIEIAYEFCKECSICALVCPKGAIQIVLEEQESWEKNIHL